MEILGDDEQGLPTPPPRRWPIGAADDANGRAPLVGDPVDVTADGSLGYHLDTGPAAVGPRVSNGVAAGVDAAADAEAAPPVSRFRFLLDVVAGPESLGLSGLLVLLMGTMTSGFSPLLILLRPQMISTPTDSAAAIADVYGVPIGGAAALGAAFGLAALLRLRPQSPPFARAVAGAAFVLGLLVVLLVGYAVWTADSSTTPFDGSVQ